MKVGVYIAQTQRGLKGLKKGGGYALFHADDLRFGLLAIATVDDGDDRLCQIDKCQPRCCVA